MNKDRSVWAIAGGSIIIALCLYYFPLGYNNLSSVIIVCLVSMFMILLGYMRHRKIFTMWNTVLLYSLLIVIPNALYTTHALERYSAIFSIVMIFIASIAILRGIPSLGYRKTLVEDCLESFITGIIGIGPRYNKLKAGFKDTRPLLANNIVIVLCGLPVLGIIAYLLGQADPIFASYMQSIFVGAVRRDIIIVAIIATVLIGYISYQYYKEETHIASPSTALIKKDIQTGGMNTIIIMLLIVFSLFIIIQMKYLFLQLGALPEGYTFSSYARGGFFQLNAVTLIVLIIVTRSVYCVKLAKSTKRLLSLTTLFTLIIAYSSAYRLLLYVDTYQYTFLRILSLSFIIVVVICLIVATYMIYKPQFPALKIMGVTALIRYLAIAYTNINMLALQLNYAHYEKTGVFDTEYVMNDSFGQQISYDAYPYLYKRSVVLTGENLEKFNQALLTHSAETNEGIHQCEGSLLTYNRGCKYEDSFNALWKSIPQPELATTIDNNEGDDSTYSSR